MELEHQKRGDAIDLAGVLQLVAQHSSTWELRELCSLLQVSSSCRQALQQSRCKCDVELRFKRLNLKAKCKLQGCAEWLVRHAGLVGRFRWIQPEEYGGREQQKELQLMQRQLALALQLCRSNAAAAAASGHVASSTQPLPLQLTAARFDYSWPEPQLMRELAASGVRKLEVSGVDWEPAQLFSPSCLASLSSLQRLTVPQHAYNMVHSAGFMSAVQQLSVLTSLQLQIVPADAARQLPPQLQALTAMFAAGSNGSTAVSLSHLTALRQLNCAGGYTAAAGAERLEVLLPPSLTHLEIRTDRKVSRLTGAAALQMARVECLRDTDVNVLVHLCSLPVLGSLRILHSSFSTPAAVEVAAAALGSATALTHFELLYVDFEGGIGSGLCRQLAKLRRLSDLRMWSCAMPEERSNVLCLTALTSLTSLALGLVSQPDDVVAAAVASHLTGLRELDLGSRSITSLGLLPVVGALTGLSSLRLFGGEGFVVGAGELMLLSRLTGLRELSTGMMNCSEADRQHFLAGMPHLTHLFAFKNSMDDTPAP